MRIGIAVMYVENMNLRTGTHICMLRDSSEHTHVSSGLLIVRALKNLWLENGFRIIRY